MIVRTARWDHIRCGDGLLCEMPFIEAAGVAARWPIWERPTLCPRCRDVHELLAGPVEVRVRMVGVMVMRSQVTISTFGGTF